MPLNEHVHCVAIAFKTTEQVEQRISIKFCVKLEHPPWKVFGWFRRPQLWATGDWQLHHNNMPAQASRLPQRFLVKQNTQVTQPPYSPGLVPCDFWLFPKPNSPLKRKRFQTISEIQENTMGQLNGNWENCVRSQVAYFEGDWGVTVLCTIFLVSCNFFNKCLYFS